MAGTVQRTAMVAFAVTHRCRADNEWCVVAAVVLTPDYRNHIQLEELRTLAALWRVDVCEQTETIAGNAAGESMLVVCAGPVV